MARGLTYPSWGPNTPESDIVEDQVWHEPTYLFHLESCDIGSELPLPLDSLFEPVHVRSVDEKQIPELPKVGPASVQMPERCVEPTIELDAILRQLDNWVAS